MALVPAYTALSLGDFFIVVSNGCIIWYNNYKTTLQLRDQTSCSTKTLSGMDVYMLPDKSSTISLTDFANKLAKNADFRNLNSIKGLNANDTCYDPLEDDDIIFMEIIAQYHQQNGDIRYLANCQPPNLAFNAPHLVLVLYLHCPTARHWVVDKCRAWYISEQNPTD